jgi:hypothetical protein
MSEERDFNTRWTPEHVDYLVGQTRLGASASQVAQALGTTRSAVLGKLQRLRAEGYDLPYRIQNAHRAEPPAEAAPSRPSALRGWARSADLQVFSLREETPVEPGPRPWSTRRFGECAYPVDGRGEDTRSCCARIVGGGSYCPTHRAVMYQ